MELNELNGEIETFLPKNENIGINIFKDKKGNIECYYFIGSSGNQKTDSLYWAIKEIIEKLKQ